MNLIDDNSKNTSSLNLFWSELLLCINCEGSSLEKLSAFYVGLKKSQESLLEMERVTGEALTKSIYWPDKAKIQNDEVSIIGFHMANMAALKYFLKQLGDEIAKSIEVKEKAEKVIENLHAMFDNDNISRENSNG